MRREPRLRPGELLALVGRSGDGKSTALAVLLGFVAPTMASLMPQGFDEDRMGAMSAAMLSLGDRTAQELARGTLEQVLIKGSQGFVILTGAGKEAVVTVLVKPNVKLGLIFLDVRRASESIAKMI